MTFGTLSAVAVFHRFGEFLCVPVRVEAKAPLGRYVDDYYGASRVGVELTGGVLLTLLAELVGRPTDPGKSEDGVLSMILLGARITVELELGLVKARIDEVKAKLWRHDLLQVLAVQRLEAGDASKFAGRLSFSVTTASDKVGRAYIKPLHAQASRPMPGADLSVMGFQALSFFVQYLEVLPCVLRKPGSVRKRAVLWTDAASTPPAVAAVLWTQEIGFRYVAAYVPDWVLEQLLPRRDKQIGVLETLALILGLKPFEDNGQLRNRPFVLVKLAAK